MFVSVSKKLLVLEASWNKEAKLRQMASLMPEAKVKWVEEQQKFWLIVPFDVEHVTMLKNLGVRARVPSPIEYYYDWPRSHKIEKPFKAQERTAAFLTMHPRAHVHNGLGSGKTLATLWAWDYLNRTGHAKKLLVIAPLSTVERAWGDTIFENFIDREFVVLHGSRQKRLQLLEQDADVYIINHDGVKVSGIVEALAERPDIDTVVIDELSQAARTATTARWKAYNTIINKQGINRRAWGLTGTPIPNAPTDAYAQAKLITPEKMRGVTFTKFKNMVMYQAGPYAWYPRANATDIVFQTLQPAIRFSREQCVDLPPTTYSFRHVELSKTQKKAYDDMMRHLVVEFHEDATTVQAANEAVKLSKLIQIACGVVYDSEGNEVDLNADERLKVVHEIVEEAEGKVIVFVPFRSALSKLADYLVDKGVDTAVVHGGVSKRERDEVFTAFQNTDKLRVLVAQPYAMSHGLTLTAANTIVWFAPITSADTYEQANGRIARPGQKRNTHIIHIEGTKAERRIYDRLEKKQKVQGVLLKLIEEAT